MRKHNIWQMVALWVFTIPAAVAGTSSPHVSAPTMAEAGRYLVQAGGCNDCHTPGWGPSGGTTPLTRWLTGSRVGFEGPWGTTYPANLRLLVHEMSETQWVAMFKNKTPLPQYPMRPPMPWVNVHRLSVRDVRALYVFIRSLGPMGKPAPAYVPPGQHPTTPYIFFVPQQPKARWTNTSP
ncbi:MAG: cytochrome C [Acidiferrobacteraceae bacterium]